VDVDFHGDGLKYKLKDSGGNSAARELTIKASKPGVYPYRFEVKGDGYKKTVEGTVQALRWKATFFKWEEATDPRTKTEAWRALADGPEAMTARTGSLDFKYGFGGPSDQKLSKKLTEAKLGGDHFGMIARTKMRLSAGRWKIATTSDDGIRVTVDGEAVVDDWTWHPPKGNDGEFTIDKDKEVEIVVEHFEIDGYATLQFELSRVE